MLESPRFQALAVIALLAGLGLWLLVQVEVGGGEVPGVPVDAIPEETAPPAVDPEGIRAGDPDAELAVSGLELAIDVDVRARILPPDPDLTPGPRGNVASQVTILKTPRGQGLVELTLSTGERIYRVVDLDRPYDSHPVDTELRGQVVDEVSAPLEGAEVWYGQGLPGEESVKTDAEGRFAISSMVGGRGVPLVVTAPGRVSRFTVMHLDGSAYREPLFVLEPGATLQVQLTGEVPAPERARVFLAPVGSGDTGLQQFPFFLPALTDTWRMGDDGTARIAGLPEGAQVEVTVWHPLAITHRSHSVRVYEGSPAVVSLRRSQVWTGRVLDPERRPLAGASVVTRSAGRELPSRRHSPRWLLPPEVDLIGVGHDRTDGEGRFEVAAGELLRITAPGYAGLEMRVDGDLGPDVKLFAYEPGEPTLRVWAPGCDGSYEVRCRPFGNEWRSVTCGQEFDQVLTEAALVDVRIQIRANGLLMEPRTFSGLPVQGLVELDLR